MDRSTLGVGRVQASVAVMRLKLTTNYLVLVSLTSLPTCGEIRVAAAKTKRTRRKNIKCINEVNSEHSPRHFQATAQRSVCPVKGGTVREKEIAELIINE